MTALSTVPGGTSLYVLGLDGKVWSNFFPPPDRPTEWDGWWPLCVSALPLLVARAPGDTAHRVLSGQPAKSALIGTGTRITSGPAGRIVDLPGISGERFRFYAARPSN